MAERLCFAVITAIALAAAGCGERAQPAWSGYVEGDYVYVASPFGGALASLDVQRGQMVSRGAPLFALDAESERTASDEAAARLESALAQAADTTKGRRADEIAVTKAQLAQARSQAALAATDLARQQKLVTQGFVSPASVDDARAQLERSRAQVDELTAARRVAQLPARGDAQTAAEALAQAQAQALRQSQWREQQKRLSAPADARVADVLFRVGEWVPAGQPVVSLLAPSATKARFFVPEAEIGSLALGQPVTIQCDGCGAPIAARIDFIAAEAEYTPPVIYSNQQRSKLVFMVEAHPDPKHGERLKPGQPLDVRRAAGTTP
jgi:HlyD family secretion protein